MFPEDIPYIIPAIHVTQHPDGCIGHGHFIPQMGQTIFERRLNFYFDKEEWAGGQGRGGGV